METLQTGMRVDQPFSELWRLTLHPVLCLVVTFSRLCLVVTFSRKIHVCARAAAKVSNFEKFPVDSATSFFRLWTRG